MRAIPFAAHTTDRIPADWRRPPIQSVGATRTENTNAWSLPMTYGPVELIVLSTPGRDPSPGVVKTLRAITERDQIRIIDVAFVHTDDAGTVSTSELADLPSEAYRRLAPIVSEVSGMIAEEDLLELGSGLGAERHAGVYLLEHHWARRLDTAVRRSGARVLLHLRVPRDAVSEVASVRADRAR